MDRVSSRTDLEAEQCYTFGDLLLEPDGTLLRAGEAIHLAPKELAALRVLLTHPGRIVTPLQMKEVLWPDVYVTSDSVPRCISSLRSRLGTEVRIRTIYKRGYRLESPVHCHVPEPREERALPRLAILPFTGRMFVPPYLGPAIAENAAVHLRNLQPAVVRILAPGSVCTMAARGFTAVEVGRKMDANLVLSGTVQTSTLFLRVRAEMLRVPDGKQIWVEEVLGPREHSAALERRLLERLAFHLGGPDLVSIPASRNQDDEEESDSPCREAFLQGRYESQSRDPHCMRNAEGLLLRAADLDPNCVGAHKELIRLSVNQCLYGFESPSVGAEQVRRAADAIPETEHMSAAILPALGWILFHVEHNLGFALQMINRVSSSEHGSSNQVLRAMLALSRWRFEEAHHLLAEALRDDPWSPSLQAQLAWAHHLAGRTRESLDVAQNSLALFPGDERVELCAALILAFNDDPHRAAELAHEVALRQPLLDIAPAIEAYALARGNRRSEAREILERLQWLGRERYVLRSFTAGAYAALGDVDGAIAELRAAEEARCPWFFQTLADPRLKPLAGKAEFLRMRGQLERMESVVTAASECMV